MAADDQTITSLEELRSHYREPSDRVRGKIQNRIDEVARSFIERCPLAVLSTSDGTRIDASPRGGPAGFIQVLDDRRVAVADLNGNNLLDSLTNIVTHGWAALLLVMPGTDDTLRVNGPASISIDDAILDGFTDELRRPKAAVVITADELYMHCGKAFKRSGAWNPDSWGSHTDAPDGADLLEAHIEGIDADEFRPILQQSYVDDIARD